MNEEIKKLIEKADHALEVAEDLLKDGYPSDAASKIYYSMFYITQALLKSEGIDVVKHSAVESAFGYYFAKTGRIDSKYHRMLINARKIREIADYDIQEEIVEPTASLKIEEGKEFLRVIKELLGKSETGLDD
ncbi:MAG: HEPN domain-containing protein [Elusimicrobiota bacterium]